MLFFAYACLPFGKSLNFFLALWAITPKVKNTLDKYPKGVKPPEIYFLVLRAPLTIISILNTAYPLFLGGIGILALIAQKVRGILNQFPWFLLKSIMEGCVSEIHPGAREG